MFYLSIAITSNHQSFYYGYYKPRSMYQKDIVLPEG